MWMAISYGVLSTLIIFFIWWYTTKISKGTEKYKQIKENKDESNKEKIKKYFHLDEKIISRTIIFIFYLAVMTCIGIINPNNHLALHLFNVLWYQLIFFAIPNILFWLWFMTEYASIIYVKCKLKWQNKDNNSNLKDYDQHNNNKLNNHDQYSN